MPLLAVIVPVYNEAPTVERAILRLDQTPPPPGVSRRIIAINDGSTDDTPAVLDQIARRLGDRLTVIHNAENRGKGAAIRAGLEAASDSDFMLIHDADLEYDPADHAEVLAPLIDDRADAVIGSRFRGGTTHRVLYFWHAVANRILTTLSNMLTNLNLSDIECCTKAFTRRVAAHLTVTENRFGVEPEIVARLARMRLPSVGPGRPSGSHPIRIFEVPVSYSGRTYAEGKKITWRDGFWAAWCIIRYNFRA